LCEKVIAAVAATARHPAAQVSTGGPQTGKSSLRRPEISRGQLLHPQSDGWMADPT